MPTLTNLFRSRRVKQPAATTTTTTTTATGTATTTAPTSAAADSSTDSSTASVTLSNANAANTQGQGGDDGGGSDGKRLCGGSLRGGGGGGSGGNGSDMISVSVVVTKTTGPLAGKFIRRLASLRGALSRRTGSTPATNTEAVTTAASPPSGEAARTAAAATATAAATARQRRGRRWTSAMSMRDVLCWPHASATIDEDSGSAAAAAAAAAAVATTAAAAAAGMKDEAMNLGNSRQRAGAPGSSARQLECLYSVRQMQGGDSGSQPVQPLPQAATEPALQPRDDAATKPGRLANSLGLMEHQQQHPQHKQLDFLSAEPLMEVEEFMKWQRRRQNVTLETAGETFVTDKVEIATTSVFMPEPRCLEAELSRQQQRELSPPAAATAAASAAILPAVGNVAGSRSGRSVCVMSSPHGLLDLSQDRTAPTSSDGQAATSSDGQAATSSDGQAATSSDGQAATSSDGQAATSSEGPAATSSEGPTSESVLLFADVKPFEGAPSVTSGAARELQQSSKDSQDQSESSCLFATLRPASGWNWSCEIGAGAQGGVEKTETDLA